MGRVVLSNFEKYIRELGKDNLRRVITAACGKNSDICMFRSKVDNSLVICDFENLRCDICPYAYENDCFRIMIDHLMEVDGIC